MWVVYKRTASHRSCLSLFPNVRRLVFLSPFMSSSVPSLLPPHGFAPVCLSVCLHVYSSVPSPGPHSPLPFSNKPFYTRSIAWCNFPGAHLGTGSPKGSSTSPIIFHNISRAGIVPPGAWAPLHGSKPHRDPISSLLTTCNRSAFFFFLSINGSASHSPVTIR